MIWVVGFLLLVYWLALAGQISKIDALEERVRQLELRSTRQVAPTPSTKPSHHRFWNN